MVAVPADEQVAVVVVTVGVPGTGSLAATLKDALIAVHPLPFVAVTV